MKTISELVPFLKKEFEEWEFIVNDDTLECKCPKYEQKGKIYWEWDSDAADDGMITLYAETKRSINDRTMALQLVNDYNGGLVMKDSCYDYCSASLTDNNTLLLKNAFFCYDRLTTDDYVDFYYAAMPTLAAMRVLDWWDELAQKAEKGDLTKDDITYNDSNDDSKLFERKNKELNNIYPFPQIAIKMILEEQRKEREEEEEKKKEEKRKKEEEAKRQQEIANQKAEKIRKALSSIDLKKIHRAVFETSLGNCVFPEGVYKKNSLTSECNELFLQFEKSHKGENHFAQYNDGSARWIYAFAASAEKIFIFFWSVCNDGHTLNLTVVPHNLHLKKDLSESTILESINKVNSTEPFTGKSSREGHLCAVFEKSSNMIFFKRSWGLPVPFGYLHDNIEMTIQENVLFTYNMIEDLFE